MNNEDWMDEQWNAVKRGEEEHGEEGKKASENQGLSVFTWFP